MLFAFSVSTLFLSNYRFICLLKTVSWSYIFLFKIKGISSHIVLMVYLLNLNSCRLLESWKVFLFLSNIADTFAGYNNLGW